MWKPALIGFGTGGTIASVILLLLTWDSYRIPIPMIAYGSLCFVILLVGLFVKKR